MRHNYNSSEVGSDITPIVLLLAVIMTSMIGYLVAYGDVLKPRQTPRVYFADALDISGTDGIKR